MLYVAGTDTTGHLLAHTVLFLLKYPEVYKKLMVEIKENDNLDDNKIEWESFQNMFYLQAVFKESLRLRPGVIDIAQREVLKDFKLEDIFIKKRTILQSGYYMSCHDERFYDNADKFIPERWLNNGKNHKTEEEEPYLFTPFSAGNRNCIGQHLAKFEAMIILVKFLKKFEFFMKNKDYVEKWVIRFLYEPKDPLLLRFSVKDD